MENKEIDLIDEVFAQDSINQAIDFEFSDVYNRILSILEK